MALRLSTLLANRLAGYQVAYAAATLSVTDADTIADSANGLLTAGFRPGMIIEISGFTGTVGNNQIAVISLVASTGATMDVVVENVLVADAEGETVTLTAYGQGLKDILSYGVMCIYTGSQPATADLAPTGTLLLLITKASGAFTKGTTTNGLEFDAPVAGVLGKKDADTWSGVGLAAGTAGWFRFYANDYNTAAGALCFDGSVGTSGAQLNLSSTSIVLAATTTIDEFEVTVPMTA